MDYITLIYIIYQIYFFSTWYVICNHMLSSFFPHALTTKTDFLLGMYGCFLLHTK